VGPRRLFGDVSELDGHPDGATLDADGGFWCALVGGSQLARFTTDGLDRTFALPVLNPTDVTFGGPGLDRVYVVSIDGAAALDGVILAIDGLGVMGRPEPRARI
jgi:sugar lactone lactonase YvrE